MNWIWWWCFARLTHTKEALCREYSIKGVAYLLNYSARQKHDYRYHLGQQVQSASLIKAKWRIFNQGFQKTHKGWEGVWSLGENALALWPKKYTQFPKAIQNDVQLAFLFLFANTPLMAKVQSVALCQSCGPNCLRPPGNACFLLLCRLPCLWKKNIPAGQTKSESTNVFKHPSSDMHENREVQVVCKSCFTFPSTPLHEHAAMPQTRECL